MKYSLILLTSIIAINANIYTDQTGAAILSNQPMFHACALGYNLNPGTCTGDYDNHVCQGWSRPGKTNPTTIETLRNKTFPAASQAASPRVNFLPSLSAIAIAAYQGGSSWDTSGPDRMCPVHGYGRGT